MAVTIRKNDIRASNLFFASLVIGSLVTLLSIINSDRPTYFSSHPGIAFFSFTAATIFCIAMALGVRAGYHRVKVVFVIYGLLSLVLYMFSLASPVKSLTGKLLTLPSSILYVWATIIVARDLLRRPVTGEKDVAIVPA